MDQPASHIAGMPVARQQAPRRPAPTPWRFLGRRPFLQSMFFHGGGEITEEQGQAVTRIVLAAIGTLVMFANHELGHQGSHPLLLALVYMLASFYHLSFVSRHPGDYLWRRYVVIVMDLAVAGMLTAHFSEAGIAFYPLFLWVMIGNGVRYGEHFMQFATLLGLLTFTAAVAASGILWTHPGTYIGLMFGLVLMPRFFLVMIDRLAAANTQLKTQKDHAEYMATHDELTGLPNRAYLHARMEQALAVSRRTGNQLAIAFIDLDAFKAINDSFGHDYGDQLLCKVADAMRAVLRAGDTVARLGGDEFVVVIEDSGDGARIGRVIDRLFACVGRYYRIGEYETYVTWSCGVVVHPRDGEDIQTLLKHADTAMYAAKQRGPNNFAFYDAAMSAAVSEQLALTDDLRQALERGQLEVFYQPIIDAESGEICSAEALLRWQHPTRGLLSPSSFIAVAEQSGLIDPIGEWVLQQAVKTAATWQRATGRSLGVNVNVSAYQLKQPGFVRVVRSALAMYPVPADAIELEMTESALIDDSARTESLKALGVRLALDDFGTGFSSLAYLKRLAVDTIKVDKSFVDDLPAGDRDTALVEAILTLGARLGTRIVAEGVESEAQAAWLTAHGCRYLQGFHFARPMREADLLDLAGGPLLQAQGAGALAGAEAGARQRRAK